MAVPTVAGGTDIATNVRTRVNDLDSTNYEFTDADLTVLLANAIDVYNRLNPYIKEWTLTTVADQKDYALPADCVRAIDVPWRPYPGLQPNVIVAYFNALYGTADILPVKDWSDEVIVKQRQEWAIRFENIGAGASEQLPYTTSYSNSKYIRLMPTPSRAGDTVLVRYTANHPIQANDYFTIPLEHVEQIRKLLTAEVLEIRGNKILTNVSDLAIGTSRFRFANSGQQLILRAAVLRQEVFDKLGQATIKMG